MSRRARPCDLVVQRLAAFPLHLSDREIVVGKGRRNRSRHGFAEGGNGNVVLVVGRKFLRAQRVCGFVVLDVGPGVNRTWVSCLWWGLCAVAG